MGRTILGVRLDFRVHPRMTQIPTASKFYQSYMAFASPNCAEEEERGERRMEVRSENNNEERKKELRRTRDFPRRGGARYLASEKNVSQRKE